MKKMKTHTVTLLLLTACLNSFGQRPTLKSSFSIRFLYIAAMHPEDPEWCYLKTYELAYFDIGVAKDINSARLTGAILGAIHGMEVFPVEMRGTFNKQMKKQLSQKLYNIPG